MYSVSVAACSPPFPATGAQSVTIGFQVPLLHARNAAGGIYSIRPVNWFGLPSDVERRWYGQGAMHRG